MNSNKIWTFGSIVAIVTLILGTWFLSVSPRLAEMSTAHDSRLSADAQNAELENALAALEDQYDEMATLESQLADVRIAVPDDAALPALIDQLNQRANANGVVITSMTVSDAEPYVPAADVSSDAELSAASASVTADNFLTMNIGLTLSGAYGPVMQFIADVQQGERLFLVHDLALTEGTMQADAPVVIVATGQVFVLLDEATVAANRTVAPPVEAEAPPAE
ncbi:MAG: hypothetical protein JWP30_1063 [Homoserinimonas sp.]|jgi:Tfp pilus assembly protein PilO|nr:hypothetical protein [Homoserinimonas sp.]